MSFLPDNSKLNNRHDELFYLIAHRIVSAQSFYFGILDKLTSSTDLKDGDSQVQPFMPERESSENSLTSRHLSDKPDGMKLRSDSVANGDIVSELDTKSRTSLHPPT